jgi:Ca-activated chloride channel family protein
MTTRVDGIADGRGAGIVTWRTVVSDFGRLVGVAFALSVALGLLLTMASVALPAPMAQATGVSTPGPGCLGPVGECGTPVVRPDQATSGSFLVRRTKLDPWTSAPVLATEVRFKVAGVVARGTIVQRFRNASDDWVEGVYVFPLPEQAAVDHLAMKVGERTIEGQIREREQARAEYQQAAASGRKASLVEQERPNIFTTSVANLGPGEELVVEIELQETLSFDRGEVRLRFPLVVGPRYIPGSELLAGLSGTGWSPDTNAVPDASRVTPPVLPPGEPLRNPVTIDVELDAGFPVETLVSRYHPVVSETRGEGRYRVRLRDEVVPADRDYELAWTPKPGTLPTSAFFEETRGDGTYALLTLFPPVGPAVEASRLPREVVFVVDTSGSMEGQSIQQARQALGLAIERLHAGDRFNVIEFNSTTKTLFEAAQPVTAETKTRARAFVAGLRANGGTEMAAALEAALVGSDDPKLVRQVVFLTDGSVGNEEQLFGLIRQRLGDTRLFTVGIGSAPNGHFMTKAAEFGHGTFTYIRNLAEVEEKMGRLFTALESPVLTGVEVVWPVGAAVESWPQRIPDLYLGEPVVVAARLEGPAGDVAVIGRRGAEGWKATLPAAHGRQAEGIAVLWARRKVQALLDSIHDGADAEEVRLGVVALGLEHHIVTKHTSLVAVDVTPARPDGEPLDSRSLPTNLPNGWSYGAVFGELPRTATPAPLHTLLTLLALLLAAALWLFDRRYRAGERS